MKRGKKVFRWFVVATSICSLNWFVMYTYKFPISDNVETAFENQKFLDMKNDILDVSHVQDGSRFPANGRLSVRNSTLRSPSKVDKMLSNIPSVKINSANCALLFKNQSAYNVTQLDKEYISTQNNPWQLPLDCESFRAQRNYMMFPGSREESKFPLAFSILMYRGAHMAERLLRAIYRPHNVYCVHVDNKAEEATKEAIIAVASCFPNVVISNELIAVEWGTMSLVDAQLACMQTLLESKKWKYLINLTGEEFPLKTNKELVEILISINGANLVHGVVKWANRERWGNLTLNPPPYNMTLTKGSISVAVKREFVDFVLHSPVSESFRKWVAHTKIPHETFFSSLNHNPQLGVPGADSNVDEKEVIAHRLRLVSWNGPDGFKKIPCHGKSVRNVCVFGIGDLPTLKASQKMFANKFNADFQPLAYDCMEELHYNRTRQQIVNSL